MAIRSSSILPFSGFPLLARLFSDEFRVFADKFDV